MAAVLSPLVIDTSKGFSDPNTASSCGFSVGNSIAGFPDTTTDQYLNQLTSGIDWSLKEIVPLGRSEISKANLGELIQNANLICQEIPDDTLRNRAIAVYMMSLDPSKMQTIHFCRAVIALTERVKLVAGQSSHPAKNLIISRTEQLLNTPSICEHYLKEFTKELNAVTLEFGPLEAFSITPNVAYDCCATSMQVYETYLPFYKAAKKLNLPVIDLEGKISTNVKIVREIYLYGNRDSELHALTCINEMNAKNLISDEEFGDLLHFVQHRKHPLLSIRDEIITLYDFHTQVDSGFDLHSHLFEIYIQKAIPIFDNLNIVQPTSSAQPFEVQFFEDIILKPLFGTAPTDESIFSILPMIANATSIGISQVAGAATDFVSHQLITYQQKFLPQILESFNAPTISFVDLFNNLHTLLNITSLLRLHFIRSALIQIVPPDCGCKVELDKIDEALQTELYATQATVSSLIISDLCNRYFSIYLQKISLFQLPYDDHLKILELRFYMSIHGFEDKNLILSAVTFGLNIAAIQTHLNHLKLAGINTFSLVSRQYDGISPILLAFETGNGELLNLLVQHGASLKRISDRGVSIVALAMGLNNINLLEDALTFSEIYGPKIEDDDSLPKSTCYTDGSPLHFAVAAISLDTISHVRSNYPELFQSWFQTRDIYGYTPLDYAFFGGNNKLIATLSDLQEPQLDPRYQSFPKDRSQNAIMNSFTQFCTIIGNNEGSNRELDFGKGIFNGVNFAQEFYSTLDPNGWNKRVDLLLDWDGLPDSLQGEGPTFSEQETYESLGGFFDAFLNALLLFQNFIPYKHNLLESGDVIASQLDRPKQLATAEVENPKLTLENFYYAGIITIDFHQLVDLIQEFSKMDEGTVIELGSGGHHTKLKIEKEGSIEYFDSNFPFPIPSTKDSNYLAKIIFNTKYARLGAVKNGFIDVAYCSYKLISNGSNEVEVTT